MHHQGINRPLAFLVLKVSQKRSICFRSIIDPYRGLLVAHKWSSINKVLDQAKKINYSLRCYRVSANSEEVTNFKSNFFSTISQGK